MRLEIKADKFEVVNHAKDSSIKILNRNLIGSVEASSGFKYCSHPSAELEIAGVKYRHEKVQKLFKAKSLGTKLLLVREPDNSHDPRAIAIYAALKLDDRDSAWEWVHVGYVPRRSLHVFESLPDNRVLEARKHSDTHFKMTTGLRSLR